MKIIRLVILLTLVAGIFGMTPPAHADGSITWVISQFNETTVKFTRSDGSTDHVWVSKWDQSSAFSEGWLDSSTDGYYVDVTNINYVGVVGISIDDVIDISGLTGWIKSEAQLYDGSPIFERLNQLPLAQIASSPHNRIAKVWWTPGPGGGNIARTIEVVPAGFSLQLHGALGTDFVVYTNETITQTTSHIAEHKSSYISDGNGKVAKNQILVTLVTEEGLQILEDAPGGPSIDSVSRHITISKFQPMQMTWVFDQAPVLCDCLLVSRNDGLIEPIYVHKWHEDGSYTEEYIEYKTGLDAGYYLHIDDVRNFAFANTKDDAFTFLDAISTEWQEDEFKLYDGSSVFLRRNIQPIASFPPANFNRIVSAWWTPGIGTGNIARVIIIVPAGESFETHGLNAQVFDLNSFDNQTEKAQEARQNFASSAGVDINEIPIFTISRKFNDSHQLTILGNGPYGPSLQSVSLRFQVTTPYETLFPVFLSLAVKTLD